MFKTNDLKTNENIDALQLKNFIQFVVYGVVDEMKEILLQNPNIAFIKTKIIDNANRTFEHASAFQYALWALDKKTWDLLLSVLSISEDLISLAQEQLDEVKSKGLTFSYQDSKPYLQKFFDATPLLDVYKKYCDDLEVNSFDFQMEKDWKAIVDEQMNLPFNFIREFFNMNSVIDSLVKEVTNQHYTTLLNISNQLKNTLDFFHKHAPKDCLWGFVRQTEERSYLTRVFIEGKDLNIERNSKMEAQIAADRSKWFPFVLGKAECLQNLTQIVPPLKTSQNSNWNVECGPKMCIIS